MTKNLSASFLDYAIQLREFISAALNQATASDEDVFNDLALNLFALQFKHNAPYRRICESRKVNPQTINTWRNIPAVPASAFKELELTSLRPVERTSVFHSSGTTGQIPSRHFHSRESLEIYEASLLGWYAEQFAKSDCLFLSPPPALVPHSSLAHMFETIRREFAWDDSHFTGELSREGQWDVDMQTTRVLIARAIEKNRPVNILGTAFSFVHLLDYLETVDARLVLPVGSRVVETGGYKGRSRVMPKRDLHHLITARLHVPRANIICEYGMSELSSQAYDSVAEHSANSERSFHFPPWAKVQLISPETGREVNEGETGLLRIIDLANVYSVMAIQTEDLGVRRKDGFELIGRAEFSEPRGCSLASI